MSHGDEPRSHPAGPAAGEAQEVPAAAPGLRLRLRVQRVEGVPVAAVRVSLPGGARVEPVPGLALVTGRSLSEGTRRRDYRALADGLEARGMLLHTGGTFESHGLALDALAEDWEEALELAAELTLEPAFPAERCAWVARQTAAELDSLSDQPEVRTAWAFLEQLYAPHPRGRPLQGTTASLAALTPADCAAFHATCRGRGLSVVVTGEVDEEAVATRVEALFGRAALDGGGASPERPQERGGPAAGDAGSAGSERGAVKGRGAGEGGALPEPPVPEGLPERRRTVALPPPEEDEPRQAHLYLGHRTIPRAHPDHDALSLAAVVLGAGSGLTGRIPERIREREGLAYSANAHTVAGAALDPGRLVVYVATSVDTVEQAERSAVEELVRFVEDGPSDEEVADARAYRLGRIPFRRETARQIADLILLAEHFGLPLDRPGWQEERLSRLTRADVHAAVRRHLHPDRLWVTVGVPEE